MCVTGCISVVLLVFLRPNSCFLEQLTEKLKLRRNQIKNTTILEAMLTYRVKQKRTQTCLKLYGTNLIHKEI